MTLLTLPRVAVVTGAAALALVTGAEWSAARGVLPDLAPPVIVLPAQTPVLPGEPFVPDTGGEVDPPSGGGGGGLPGEVTEATPETTTGRLPVIARASTRVNDATTSDIVLALEDTDNGCAALPRHYLVDCVARGYDQTARRLPRKGDYSDARDALARVSGQLDSIVRETQDRQQPRAAVTVRPRDPSRPPVRTANITAIAAPLVETATTQAAEVVEQERLVLLRSVPDTDVRAVHYERISDAFESTAILLRS